MTVYWVNLRGTSGGPASYVGDGAGNSYCIGEAYPTGRQVNGYDFGFTASVTATANDKSYYPTFPHQAGFIGFGSQSFRISGLTGGQSYTIYLSGTLIDGSSAVGYKFVDSDATTVLGAVISSPGAVAVDNYMDANGVVWGTGPSAWVAGQTGRSVTPSGSTLYISPGTSPAYFSAVGIEPGAPPPAAVGTPTLMMMGV